MSEIIPLGPYLLGIVDLQIDNRFRVVDSMIWTGQNSIAYLGIISLLVIYDCLREEKSLS